ncbi:hypothetical protein B0H14DRAFT_1441965 [Mycena olivaceomarginata]|nr:hypothetical protein B0H14DRAFT_1441965 [Mycena olivaceomarginata]
MSGAPAPGSIEKHKGGRSLAHSIFHPDRAIAHSLPPCSSTWWDGGGSACGSIPTARSLARSHGALPPHGMGAGRCVGCRPTPPSAFRVAPWTRSTRSFTSMSDVRTRVLLLNLLRRATTPPLHLWCATQAARTPGHLGARATPALPSIPPWVPSRTSRAGRKAIFSRAEAVRTAGGGAASRWRRRHALRAVGCGLCGGVRLSRVVSFGRWAGVAHIRSA